MPLSDAVITELHAVNLISFSGPISRRRTDRPCTGLMYKQMGLTEYTFGGTTLQSSGDCFILLPRGCSYEFSVRQPGQCIGVECRLEGTALPTEPVRFAPAAMPEIGRLFCSVRRCWDEKPSGWHGRCFSELYRILSRTAETDQNYGLRSKETRIEPSVRWLMAHYLESSLTGEQLAEVSGISEVYFRRIFTAVYGMPPRQYILALRIAKAKELLAGDYATLEDVALSCGYGSVYHFCKSFRSATGETPSRYAKSRKRMPGAE